MTVNKPLNKIAASHLLLVGAIAFGSFTLSGCSDVQASGDAKPEVAIVTIPVEVADATQGAISSHYATTAVLEAKQEAQVVSKIAGIVEAVFVEEGDYVEAGQVLARIEQKRYQLNLNKAQAELSQVQSELNRVAKVHGQNLVSTDSYEKLKWQVESIKAALEVAKLNLKETEIVAPISGFIAQRYVKTGNLVQQHQQSSLFYIVEQKQLQGIVHLPEQQLSQVKVGQQTLLKLAALGDSQITANIERISTIVDPKTGTFKVTLNIPNQQGLIKAGMFAEVNIRYNTHNDATLIPRKALISLDNVHTVYTVVDGKVNKHNVEIGFQEGSMVEILSGLDQSATVVIAGHNNLKDNAHIEIIKTI